MATRMNISTADGSKVIRYVGTAAADDPGNLTQLTTGTATRAYPIHGAKDVMVWVLGDNAVTGTPAVEGAMKSDGPWKSLGTISNPTTTGDSVVPTAGTSYDFIRVNCGSFTGGPVRAILTAHHVNGNRLW